MKKIFFSFLTGFLSLTMIIGFTTNLNAEEVYESSEGTIQTIGQDYIYPDESSQNHYNIGLDTAYDLYTDNGFNEPTDPAGTELQGQILNWNILSSPDMPAEMTFDVEGAPTSTITVDTSDQSLTIAYSFFNDVIVGQESQQSYNDESVYVMGDDGTFYEVAYSYFDHYPEYNETDWLIYYQGTSGEEQVIYFFQEGFPSTTTEPIQVYFSYLDTSFDEPVCEVDCEEPPMEEPPVEDPTTNAVDNTNSNASDKTKVVNGPGNANAAMVIVTSGIAAIGALATISRRK